MYTSTTVHPRGRGFPTPDGYIAAIAAARGFIVASRDTAPYEAARVSVINQRKMGITGASPLRRASRLSTCSAPTFPSSGVGGLGCCSVFKMCWPQGEVFFTTSLALPFWQISSEHASSA